MNLYHFIWNVMDLRALQEIYGNIRKSSMDIVTLFWILVDVDICWRIWISLEYEWPDPKISWYLLRFSPAHPDPTAPLQRLQRRAVHGGRPGSPQTLLGPGAFSGLGLREHLQTTIVLICFDDWIGWGLSYKWIYDNITIVRGAPYHNFWRQRHDYCIPIIPVKTIPNCTTKYNGWWTWFSHLAYWFLMKWFTAKWQSQKQLEYLGLWMPPIYGHIGDSFYLALPH